MIPDQRARSSYLISLSLPGLITFNLSSPLSTGEAPTRTVSVMSNRAYHQPHGRWARADGRGGGHFLHIDFFYYQIFYCISSDKSVIPCNSYDNVIYILKILLSLYNLSLRVICCRDILRT